MRMFDKVLLWCLAIIYDNAEADLSFQLSFESENKMCRLFYESSWPYFQVQMLRSQQITNISPKGKI